MKNVQINKIKLLRNTIAGEIPTASFLRFLYNNKCYSIIKHINIKDAETNPIISSVKALDQINRMCVNARFDTISPIIEALNERGIPYAMLKGPILSKVAYGDFYYRFSSDIDLLTTSAHVDLLKKLLISEGFVQGRIIKDKIAPFSREEQLFYSATSHQIAPFLKQTSTNFCPFVNVDVNTDIMWGEHFSKTNMNYVLKYTCECTFKDLKLNKLTTEMEFLSLCLHHYKDLNSLYLLTRRNIKLELFCDIFFYIQNNDIDFSVLKKMGELFSVNEYIYYCLYYTNLVFYDSKIKNVLPLFSSDRAIRLLDYFGLNETERTKWTIGFYERLFADNLPRYILSIISESLKSKIKLNEQYIH